MKTGKVILCLLLFAQLVIAQRYHFHTINEDNGLPQEFVYHISQDNKGYIYFSTGDGFAIYNSRKMQVFTTQQKLSENFCTTHFIDSQNRCWIGHLQNGISLLINKKVQNVHFKELRDAKITSITEDKAGNILIGTLGKGLFAIDKNLRLKTLGGLNSENICALHFVSKNCLAIGSSDGISFYQYQNNISYLYSVDALEDIKVKSISQDKKNNLWLGTFGKGIVKLSSNQGKYQYQFEIEVGDNRDDVNELVLDHHTLWAGTFGNGISKIVFDDDNYQTYSHTQFTAKNGLLNLYINAIFQDKEGCIWSGTSDGGVYQLIDEQFLFYNLEAGLAHDDIQSITRANDHLLYLGTHSGVDTYDLLTHKTIKKNEIVDDEITGLLTDSAGTLWIGTANHGLYFKIKNQQSAISANRYFGFSNKTISALVCRKNHLYVGSNEGLIVIDIKSKKSKQISTAEGLSNNQINGIAIDKNGNVWFACHGSGPFSYKQGEFTVYKDIEGLKSYNFNCVNVSDDGTVWFGSEGDGIFSFDGHTFKNYNVDNGLLSNYAYSIIPVKSDVWICSKNGVSKLNIHTKKIKNYTENEGFISQECDLNAYCLTNKGELWIGTEKGLMCINTLNQRKHFLPPVLIESVHVNDSLLEKENLNLPYDTYEISFQVNPMFHSNPKKTKFRYMLEGLDKHWIYANSETETITYPKIEDGSYRLVIQACSEEGLWNPETTNYRIFISKPFWKETWFILLCALSLIFSIQLYSNIKTKSLIKRQRELEKIVDEKTLEIRKQNEQLELSNQEITDSITYAKRIQEAILPGATEITVTEKAFIYYQPRDIVSGDFYWYYPYSDTTFLIAAADCTGHGVPGAFLTMMGTTLLNKIIKDLDVTQPSEILKQLDVNVRESLHQTHSDATKDGMDIAMCKIDITTNQLDFAGAGRPLYLVRSKELHEYRPSFHSIGYFNDGLEKEFENHCIQTLPNDMIYIFSDGYADQFGGENKQKFMTKRLKELVVNISDKPLDTQKQLIHEAFTSWKGSNKQIDDILVIGIKIS